MEEVGWVKNIKQKFENRNNIGIDKFEQKKRIFNNLNFMDHCTESSNKNCNILDSSNDQNSCLSNHRINVKRTPAFRRDKVHARNNDDKCENSININSIVINRVNHFNKLQNDENTKSQELDRYTQTNETNGKRNISKSMNVDHISGTIVIRKNDAEKNDSMSDEHLPVYAKIKKPQKSAKALIKSKKLAEEASSTCKDSFDCRRMVKSKYAVDGNKRTENSVNKENKLASTCSQMTSDKINDDLSDTLKRVLRSPLPPGPPPKKPPRTFTVKPMNSTSSGTSRKYSGNNFIGSDTNFSDSNECHFVSGIPRPVRSKTESEIMLKKIENALMKHQKFAVPINLNSRKPSYPFHSKPEKYAEIHKNRRKVSDRSFVELSRSNSSLSPTKCNLNNTEQKTNIDLFRAHLSNSNIQLLKQEADNHIYEDPKEINAHQPSPTNEVLATSLYYMSTPIDSIAYSAKNKTLKDVVDATNSSVRVDNISFKTESNNKLSNDIFIENKIKTWVNDAYGYSCIKSPNDNCELDLSVNMEDVLPQTVNDTNDIEEYDQVTLLRKGYVKKVASRAIFHRQSIMSLLASDYKHLFECLLLIGLDLDSHNNKVPYVKMKYPDNVDLPYWIEHMCFPDAHEWSYTEVEKPTNDVNEGCYVITLTAQSGQRKYVYCRRIKPEGESFSLPLIYCILSSHRTYEFYLMVLEEIENRHGQSDVKFKNFIKELYEHKFPIKGQVIKINTYSDNENMKIKEEIIGRPQDTRVEDLRLAKILSYLKIDLFLIIFSSMLLERKVILLSSSISKLSACIGGLQVALLPFHWQHTLITVVPPNLISVMDLCEAPTPYLIGLLKPKNNSTTVLPAFSIKQQVIVVDLDEKKTLRKVGDENSILPSHLSKGIKNALQLAHSSESRTNNLLACEAFTRLFVELIGHYRRYIIPHGSDLNQKKSFQKEAFIRAASPHSVRMFLEWFVETASFATFIELRLSHNSESRGLFEQRCIEYFDELNKLKYAKNKKIVKQIGDLIKDWTTTS